MHTFHCYFKPGAGVLKRQDKQLPYPNGPLSSIIHEAIRELMLTTRTGTLLSTMRTRCSKSIFPIGPI